MRMMAEENRLSRRALGESIHRVNSITDPGKRFTRTIFSASREGRAYIIMSMSPPEQSSEEQYLELRRGDLLLHAYGCKLKFEQIKEVIGVTFAPGQEILTSVDYFLINFGEAPLDSEFAQEVKQRLSDADMWSPIATNWSLRRPIPFPYKITILDKVLFWLRSSLYRFGMLLRNIR